MNQFFEFLKNLKTVGLEAFNRYYSTYPGIVVSIDDPDQRGRIQVICPSIFGINYTLPQWAEDKGAKLTGKVSGEFFPPYVGGYVEVEFEHGDLNHPMFSGGFIPKGNLPSDFTSSYGNVRGWVFASGQKILIDETNGKESVKVINNDGSQMVFDASSKTAVFQHSSGAGVGIDSSGNVTVKDKSGNESLVLQDGEVSLTSQGEATFSGKSQTTVGDAGGPTNVNGSSVALAGGGSPIAVVGISKAVGIGNAGQPVTSTIISGSQKVTSS